MRYAADAHGGDLCAKYDFSINVSPLGMSRAVRRACTRALAAAARYPDPHCTRLRRALAEKEGGLPENILAGNGAAELIYAYAAAHAGGHALILSPTFSEYERAMCAFGGSAEHVFGYAEAEEKCTQADVVFVCVPNNPDGGMPGRAELFSLAAACAQAGTELFVDACFFDFVSDPPFALRELAAMRGVLVLQAFTKSCALAGVRLGYILGEHRVLEALAKTQQPWNVSAVAQAAGIAAAGDSPYFERLRRTVCRERAYLDRGLRRAGFSPRPSAANFLLFEGPADLAARLRRAGIAVRVCTDFVGLLPQAGRLYYRIGVRTHAENRAFLRRLREEGRCEQNRS